MFSSLKHDQSDTIQKKESEDDVRHLGGNKLVLNEKKTIENMSKNHTKGNQL